MTEPVRTLIDECTRRGIHLEPAGDKLRYKAPKGALTPDLVAELKRHKPKILEALSQPPANDNAPDLSAVERWLDQIGETNPKERARVMEAAKQDPVLHSWLMRDVAPIATSAIERRPRHVQCSDCRHFRPNGHLNMGHCAAGEPEAPAGLVGSDLRACRRHEPKLH